MNPIPTPATSRWAPKGVLTENALRVNTPQNTAEMPQNAVKKTPCAC